MFRFFKSTKSKHPISKNPFDQLPDELMLMVCHYLDAVALRNLSSVNKRFHSIVADKSLDEIRKIWGDLHQEEINKWNLKLRKAIDKGNKKWVKDLLTHRNYSTDEAVEFAIYKYLDTRYQNPTPYFRKTVNSNGIQRLFWKKIDNQKYKYHYNTFYDIAILLIKHGASLSWVSRIFKDEKILKLIEMEKKQKVIQQAVSHASINDAYGFPLTTMLQNR